MDSSFLLKPCLETIWLTSTLYTLDGSPLGNFPQYVDALSSASIGSTNQAQFCFLRRAFSHVSLISTIFNVDRSSSGTRQ